MSEQVHIYSGEHMAYWRPNGCGYTTEVSEAGLWLRADAERRISGCGPEKWLKLIPAAARVAVDSEQADNYETRLLTELSQLTTQMVWNRRRVRVVMKELEQLWDAVDESDRANCERCGEPIPTDGGPCACGGGI